MFQDGTIGDDLVVKPAPPSVLDYLDSEPLRPYSESSSHWTNSGRGWGNVSRYHHDLEDEQELPVDYAFLDEDEEVDYNSVDGFSLRSMRRRREAECEACVKTGAHIVFKRRDVREDAEETVHGHGGDYSELYIRQGCFTAFLIFMGSEKSVNNWP